MTIDNELLKLQTNLDASYDACEEKGATLPVNKNFDNLASCIDTIETATNPVISSLSITPTTSAQTITAPSGTDGYSPITVSAVTSSIDNDIIAGNIKSGVNILGVNGSVIELNGQTKTVTPTTSNQTITPDSPKNGLTSVTVNKVTSSIDSNIKATNIKSGVSILGVSGSVTELQGETKSVSLTNSSGQTFTPSSNKNGITSITVTPNNQARTVTPTTSSQSLTVNSGYSGNGTITVNAVTSSIDSNITAGNIKSGVSILGVTGSYAGTSPSGTLSITDNGTYDVTNYASASVSVDSGYVIETVTLSISISYPHWLSYTEPTKPQFTIYSDNNAVTLDDNYSATFSKVTNSFTWNRFAWRHSTSFKVPKSVNLSWSITPAGYSPSSGTLNLSSDYTLSITNNSTADE